MPPPGPNPAGVRPGKICGESAPYPQCGVAFCSELGRNRREERKSVRFQHLPSRCLFCLGRMAEKFQLQFHLRRRECTAFGGVLYRFWSAYEGGGDRCDVADDWARGNSVQEHSAQFFVVALFPPASLDGTWPGCRAVVAAAATSVTQRSGDSVVPFSEHPFAREATDDHRGKRRSFFRPRLLPPSLPDFCLYRSVATLNADQGRCRECLHFR